MGVALATTILVTRWHSQEFKINRLADSDFIDFNVGGVPYTLLASEAIDLGLMLTAFGREQQKQGR